MHEASKSALEASKTATAVSKNTFEDLTYVGKSTLGDLTKSAKEAAAKKGLLMKVTACTYGNNFLIQTVVKVLNSVCFIIVVLIYLVDMFYFSKKRVMQIVLSTLPQAEYRVCLVLISSGSYARFSKILCCYHRVKAKTQTAVHQVAGTPRRCRLPTY